MKFNEIKDREHLFGIELIPETEREVELLRRFWAGGVNLGGFDGRSLTFDFGDLVEPTKREKETKSPDRVPTGTRVTAAPIATSPTLHSIRDLATPLPTPDATLVLTYLLRYDKHAHVENVIMDIISRTQKE